MRAVLDTMVFAYAWAAPNPNRQAAIDCIEETRQIGVPDLFHAELANVLSRQVRAGEITAERALAVLDDAGNLRLSVTRSSALWVAALRLAIERRHPAYDAFFVALAAESGVKLVTFDGAVLAKFPEHAIHGRDYAERRRAGRAEA